MLGKDSFLAPLRGLRSTLHVKVDVHVALLPLAISDTQLLPNMALGQVVIKSGEIIAQRTHTLQGKANFSKTCGGRRLLYNQTERIILEVCQYELAPVGCCICQTVLVLDTKVNAG